MADLKISQLNSIVTVVPATDVLPVVQGATTYKMTPNQILGSGGVATLASATITGDLTVDTNVLKVDTTLNRVGIGTASPIAGSSLDVRGAVGTGTDIQSLTLIDTSALAINNGGGLSFGYVFESPNTVIGRAGYIKTIKENATDGNYASAMVFGVTANGASTAERYRIGSDGTSTWSVAGTTAMTLNSTGLGIGASPATKLDVRGANNASQATFSGTASRGLLISTRSDGLADDRTVILNAQHSTGSLGQLVIQTAGTDRLLIDSSGNVGIGVTPSAWTNQFKAIEGGDSNNQSAVSFQTNASAINLHSNSYYSSGYKYKFTGTAGQYALGGNQHEWYIAPSGTAGDAITFTQAMTLDASGNLLVGLTVDSYTPAKGVSMFSGNSSRVAVGHANGTSSGDYYHSFAYNSTLIGSISQNGTTGVLYNTSSDYRLKESVKPISGGLARVNALKPSIYNWKSDGSTGEGFLAHELAEVVPFAVSGEKDAVNADGTIKSQGIDMSRIVPILVAAIQELTAEVNALKNA